MKLNCWKKKKINNHRPMPIIKGISERNEENQRKLVFAFVDICWPKSNERMTGESRKKKKKNSIFTINFIGYSSNRYAWMFCFALRVQLCIAHKIQNKTFASSWWSLVDLQFTVDYSGLKKKLYRNKVEIKVKLFPNCSISFNGQ